MVLILFFEMCMLFEVGLPPTIAKLSTIMNVFIPVRSNLIIFIEGLCGSNPREFELSDFDGIELTT